MPLIAGIALGLASMAACAAAGLAGVLLAQPSLQLATKALGSLYLVWLAWKIASSGPPHLREGPARPLGFLAGAWMLWHNPKGWVMTLGAAASFAALASGPGTLAFLLGVTLAVAAAVSLSLWCVAGYVLARHLCTPRQLQVVNVCLGLLLVASIASIWL